MIGSCVINSVISCVLATPNLCELAKLSVFFILYVSIVTDCPIYADATPILLWFLLLFLFIFCVCYLLFF